MLGVFSGYKSGDATKTAAAVGLVKRLGSRCSALHFPLDVAAGVKARGFNPGVFKQVVSPASQQKFDFMVGDLRGILSGAGLVA
jgi:4-hydroxy-tetrahydrodipicolinate synthase